jgi:hypothetical protein
MCCPLHCLFWIRCVTPSACSTKCHCCFLSLSISTSVVITLVDLINDEYMLLRYMGAELFLTGKISCCIILLAVLLGAQYRAPHSYWQSLAGDGLMVLWEEGMNMPFLCSKWSWYKYCNKKKTKGFKTNYYASIFCHILLCSLSFGKHAGIIYSKYYVTQF